MNRREMLRVVAGAGAFAFGQTGCTPVKPTPSPSAKSDAKPLTAVTPAAQRSPTIDSAREIAVVHWGSDHMMNSALLPKLAAEFNQTGVTVGSKRIRVITFSRNSGIMTDELVARVETGTGHDGALPNPALVTPAADHWIGEVNARTGQTVVDTSQSQTLAATWIGIVTHKEMAEVLGWPNKEIGFADIIALRANPQGWGSVPGAKPKWGPVPLISFTDPSRSSTGRSMLYALYAIAANKRPDELTLDDVARPEVTDYIRKFQRGVDHYVFDTIALNSMAWTGPTFGHFYFMVESNLVQLYKGLVPVVVNRQTVSEPLPRSRPMVMIYPKEGSIAHNHSANFIQAPWVTPEQKEAAQKWIAYLLEDKQQQALVDRGFRPATNIPLDPELASQYGLDWSKPTRRLNPDTIKPSVAMKIVDPSSWEAVKKPGIVAFVVDTSGSMAGQKLVETKKGLELAIEEMAQQNSVGLVEFSDKIKKVVNVDKLAENKYQLSDAIQAMRADGGTALYDAVKKAVEMVDSAEGVEDSIRGVVIVTDGQANTGGVKLHDLVAMESRQETTIPQCTGFDRQMCNDSTGLQVDIKDVIGTDLKLQTKHPIKTFRVFFVGVGDASAAPNWEVCRIISEGAHSECRESTASGIAEVIRAFGKYF